MSWPIGDILVRTDLGALLDELTEPAARSGPGRRWHCPMPDHEDHRASVSMHRDSHGHERWRCWSGDHRGDAIDLVTATTGQTRADAIEWLAARAGVQADRPLPPMQPRSRVAPAGPAVVPDPVIERYANYCARQLDTPAGEQVRTWMHARGFTDATMEANRLGVDPGRATVTRRRGLPYGAGVAATLPVFDPSGEIVYVQARYLDPAAVGRKYENPSSVLAPHPRLAFPVSSDAVDRSWLLVCEGLPDALIGAQAGFRTVGLLGAQTPDDAVALRIAHHARNHRLDVALVCDPDPAGRHVADVLAPRLAAQGFDATIVTTPTGLDLNDWALTDPTWTVSLERALDTGITVDL